MTELEHSVSYIKALLANAEEEVRYLREEARVDFAAHVAIVEKLTGDAKKLKEVLGVLFRTWDAYSSGDDETDEYCVGMSIEAVRREIEKGEPRHD